MHRAKVQKLVSMASRQWFKINRIVGDRVFEIVLSLAGHFKLFAGHLIEFNYSYSRSGEFPRVTHSIKKWVCLTRLRLVRYEKSFRNLA